MEHNSYNRPGAYSIYFSSAGLVFVGVGVGKWKWAIRVQKAMQSYAMNISLILKLWFMVPPSVKLKQDGNAVPVRYDTGKFMVKGQDVNGKYYCRFLFTKYNRLTSVEGQTSLAEMISLLCRTAEQNLGFLTVRLYRLVSCRAVGLSVVY